MSSKQAMAIRDNGSKVSRIETDRNSAESGKRKKKSQSFIGIPESKSKREAKP